MYALPPVRKIKHSDRMTENKVEDKYNWDGVNFSTSFDGVTKLENNNEICAYIFERHGQK